MSVPHRGAPSPQLPYALASASLASHAASTLDYEFFKAKVQPIFLTKRPGHAPCVVCHAEANNMLHLEKLPAGQTAWTEEQTRKNFDTVSKIVQAVDDPLTAESWCIRWRRRPAATPSIQAAASSPTRTIPVGRSSPNGPRARPSPRRRRSRDGSGNGGLRLRLTRPANGGVRAYLR